MSAISRIVPAPLRLSLGDSSLGIAERSDNLNNQPVLEVDGSDAEVASAPLCIRFAGFVERNEDQIIGPRIYGTVVGLGAAEGDGAAGSSEGDVDDVTTVVQVDGGRREVVCQQAIVPCLG